jgi:hypothetical protein
MSCPVKFTRRISTVGTVVRVSAIPCCGCPGSPAKSIGRVSGGRARTTGLIHVALIQSLIKKGVVDDRVADYGHIIVDE